MEKEKQKSIFSSKLQKTVAIILCGIICGLIGYVSYAFRLTSYLSDDAETCMNCHIMAPYYATWAHGSHSQNTTCVDCHLPQDNAVQKWFFKGKDGIRHTTMFLMKQESDVINAIEASSTVIMNNCIRCHEQLNQEFVKTGRSNFKMAQHGNGKACWDCHRNVPHGKNSLSSTPHAIVPHPKTITPDWIKTSSKKNNNNKTNK